MGVSTGVAVFVGAGGSVVGSVKVDAGEGEIAAVLVGATSTAVGLANCTSSAACSEVQLPIRSDISKKGSQ